MNECTGWTIFGTVVVLGLVAVALGGIALDNEYRVRKGAQVVEAIEAGASPHLARCAVWDKPCSVTTFVK